MSDIEQTRDPMEMVNHTSQLWIGAKVIGFSGDRNCMDLQIVLTDGTHMRIHGPIKPDPIFNGEKE